MTFRTTFALALIALIALLALPLQAKNKKDADPQPVPEKQEKKEKQRAIQLRVQAGAFVVLGAFNNPLHLVRNPKVQEELKLSDDQKTKVRKALQESNSQRQQLYGTLRGLQGEERKKKQAKMRKKLQKKSADLTKTIRAALKPEQVERLDQIALQMRGIRVLSEDKIAAKLQLTDEQKKQLQDVTESTKQKRIELSQDIRNGNVERTKYRNKLEGIKKASETKSLDVLTDEQKARFKKLKGARFDFPQRQRLQIQAVPAPAKPGQLKKLQIQQGKIQAGGKPIKIRIQAAQKK